MPNPAAPVDQGPIEELLLTGKNSLYVGIVGLEYAGAEDVFDVHARHRLWRDPEVLQVGTIGQNVAQVPVPEADHPGLAVL